VARKPGSYNPMGFLGKYGRESASSKGFVNLVTPEVTFHGNGSFQ
jgi:hypothetical protein